MIHIDLCCSYLVDNLLCPSDGSTPTYGLHVYDEDVTTFVVLGDREESLRILSSGEGANLACKLLRVLLDRQGQNWALSRLFPYVSILHEGVYVNGQIYDWDDISEVFSREP